MRARMLLLCLLCCLGTSPVFGKSIWVLQGLGSTVLAPCQFLLWRPDVVFHNRTAADATVRPLHLSNQPPGAPQTFQPITVPAGASAVPAALGEATAWIAQFEVPDTLGVEGRMELAGPVTCAIGLPPPAATKLRMPVFTRLVPAGEEQVHYGTDLGIANVRLNVGIYNAGTEWASANISVVRPFCATATLTQSATIPSDTFVQVSLPNVPPCGGAPQSSAAYTVVTVDQPSLSLVSTLVNGATPGATAAVTGGN